MMQTVFRRIDLNANFQICLRFRTDSFLCSFDNLDGIGNEMGPEGVEYKNRMIDKCHQLPDGNLHLFLGDEIVGQLEMRYLSAEKVAYVNLFYIVPEKRLTGLGRVLHERAHEVAIACGANKLRLSVSTQNMRALGFYARLGWREAGARPGKEGVILMELPVQSKKRLSR